MICNFDAARLVDARNTRRIIYIHGVRVAAFKSPVLVCPSPSSSASRASSTASTSKAAAADDIEEYVPDREDDLESSC